MKIALVAGARPNFVKISPLIRAINNNIEKGVELKKLLIHTGQHHDYAMSGSLFKQLNIPEPDYFLNKQGGSHAKQTGKTMIAIEAVLDAEQPDLVVVVGDVNSSLAAAISAKKLKLKLAHVESGLRSHDRNMPEEINRILIDSISDLHFVTEKSGYDHLIHEGIPHDKIFFHGNVMIDTLLYYIDKIDDNELTTKFGICKKNYILCTFHRPSNVDEKPNATILVNSIRQLAQNNTIVIPLHPRTAKAFQAFDLLAKLDTPSIKTIPPQPYLEFITLQKNAKLVLTDSGGIQEESLILNTPCLTIRENTERPCTIDAGLNMLCELDNDKIQINSELMLNAKRLFIPPYWDGKSSERIIDTILRHHKL